MSRRAYRTSIPADAAEVVETRHANGLKKSASYFVGGEKVGHREWDEDGWLDYEYALRGGVKHGYEYRWLAEDRLLSKEPYRDGRLHGVGRQWAEDGRLLVTWKLVHGTGLDLWCNDDGTLAEEIAFPKEGERGYKRMWNADQRTVWVEELWVAGSWSFGICRQWNDEGRLRRGFPRFRTPSGVVTKRQYLRACQQDPTLPPYRPEDDAPHRELPAAFLAQRTGSGANLPTSRLTHSACRLPTGSSPRRLRP
jgi:hypothetical protein